MAPPPARNLLAAAAALATIVFSAAASAASTGELRAAYNADVARLGIAKIVESTMTPADIVNRFRVGPHRFENLRQMTDHIAVGNSVVVRGNLIVSEAEEMVASAAPRRVRLHAAASFVPLDVSALDRAAQMLIERYCGFIACDVTIHGTIGEIEIERVTNVFSPTGEMTVMIGVVAERAQFHAVGP